MKILKSKLLRDNSPPNHIYEINFKNKHPYYETTCTFF